VDTQKQVIVYHRWGNGGSGATEYFIIALNFSDQGQQVTLPFPVNGTWNDMLSGQKVEVSNFRHAMTLESNWGHVLFIG
jgi:pullulanase